MSAYYIILSLMNARGTRKVIRADAEKSIQTASAGGIDF